MADRGNADIRLEAAMAKMWNTEVGWRIVDDTLQIKGGRGYETADSLRSRGERPDPVERMMRDYRINLIFEGSSEIMRLFIAREAVDTHLKLAGDLIDPKAPMGRSFRRCSRSGASTRTGTPGSGSACADACRATANSARSATHVRFVDRSSRRLARTLFHCMVRFGPKLEKRQAVLGRLVEIGAELLAITAACCPGLGDGQAGKDPGRERGGAVELADLFSRQARRRVEERFAAVFDNDDVRLWGGAAGDPERAHLAGDGMVRRRRGGGAAGMAAAERTRARRPPAIFRATILNERRADGRSQKAGRFPSPGPRRSTSACSRPSSTPAPIRRSSPRRASSARSAPTAGCRTSRRFGSSTCRATGASSSRASSTT